MHSVTTKKAALAALLVLAALLSIFAVGKRASDPAYHQSSIDALAEKQETVLELTAASTAASAAITLLPGDTATPIAEKLADLSGYFLIVLCAIFLEKYLLTITSYVSFTILIPAACALGIAALFSEKLRAALGTLAWHVLLFALAIAFAIPAGVKVSSMIEDIPRLDRRDHCKRRADDRGYPVCHLGRDGRGGKERPFRPLFQGDRGHHRSGDRRGRAAQNGPEPLYRGPRRHARYVVPDPDFSAAVFCLARQADARHRTAAAACKAW